MGKKSKDKKGIESYSAKNAILDIVMLILGLIFLINAIVGKSDDVAVIFIRVIAGILIAVGIFAIINFISKSEKAIFDWIIMIFCSAIMIFGIVFMVKPRPILDVLNWIMGSIIIVYAIVIIFTAVAVLKPARADYWTFSLFFGLATLILGFLTIFLNLATTALVIMIGITLIVGSIGGLANAILALQAKKLATKVIKAEAASDTARKSGSDPKEEQGSYNDKKDEDDDSSSDNVIGS